MIGIVVHTAIVRRLSSFGIQKWKMSDPRSPLSAAEHAFFRGINEHGECHEWF